MQTKGRLSIILSIGLILGVYEGRIALWKGNDPTPLQVFPYPISTYPEQDRTLLEAGIPIDSESRLHSLLEDYLS